MAMHLGEFADMELKFFYANNNIDLNSHVWQIAVLKRPCADIAMYNFSLGHILNLKFQLCYVKI